MTIKGTERLLNLLRAHGVKHFKTVEIEVTFGEGVTSIPVIAEKSTTKVPESAAAAPPVQMEIPHHINEVQKLLKLGDEDLVNALFPDHTQPEGGV
jgi:hypothetical protein